MISSRSHRRLRPGALLTTLGVAALPLLAPLPSVATNTAANTVAVSVTNYRFSPSTVVLAQGLAVTWTFHAQHTSTSNQRFWNSGVRSSGTYTVRFRDAGTFGYHCTMHPSMTGRVLVPLRVTGSAAHGWKLMWSSRTSTPASRRYDVQVRKPGTWEWSAYRTGTARRSAFFNPAHTGTYVFRARTHNVSHGASGWSPTLALPIS
jgi:plastocyanin